MRKVLATFLTGLILNPAMVAANPGSGGGNKTATPIKHIVIIFDENISFDHYFGTYPVATNPKGESKFKALPNTPTVNGLTTGLLTNNPNLNPANVGIQSNPFRLDPSQAVTTDQDHAYTDEQYAYDAGLLDLFPSHTGYGTTEPMGYYDGNTVTAMWNY